MPNAPTLTILAGPTVPTPLPPHVVELLESATVTTRGGRDDGFELRFRLSGRTRLTTDFVLAGAQSPEFRVILIVTLMGMPHVIADGILVHHQMDSQGDQPVLVLQGRGLAELMDREDRTGLMQYMGMPPTARVGLILARYARYGFLPLVLPSIGDAIPDPMERSPIHEGTDLQYVQHLGELAGNEFFVLPGPAQGTSTAYWGPPTKVGVPQPALNVTIGPNRNVDQLNFRIDTSRHEQPTITLHEPITKMAIPVPIPTFSPLSPAFGLVRPQPPLKTRVAGTSKKSLAESLVEGFAAASRSQDTVFGTGSLNVLRYGHVLRARSPVLVRGATAPFDGLYYVSEVTHSIQRGRYTQTFELRRDGLMSTVSL